MTDNEHPINQLLKLTAAQLRLSKYESAGPVETLSATFTELARITSELFAQSQHNSQNPVNQFLFEQLTQMIQNAVVAFQFYDRLSQNMDHIIEHLESAQQLLEQGKSEHHEVWQEVILDMKKSYTMENERKIYNAIMQGASVDQAMLVCKTPKPDDSSDIEFF